MTRLAQATPTVTARRKARAAASALSKPALMKFLIGEDNGGAYHWTIVASSGETLVRSESFATYDEAIQAARIVHGGAGSAPLDDRGGDASGLSGLVTRRKTAVVRDDLDAERWLDEGGNLSSEAVTRWPAPR